MAQLLANDKQKAIDWIEKLIIAMHEQIIKNVHSSSSLKSQVSSLKSLQSLHTLLKTTNANPRFAIEDTFLSLLK
jgi:hypothetical protein